MAIRKIARLGHPVLRTPARDLLISEIQSDPIRRLIEDMKQTMQEYSGIGLAAPQIHEPLRLALIEIPEEGDRYPGMKAQPLLVLINPRTEVLDETKQSFWEGCLSVPGLRGLVHRPRKVKVDYLDELGKPKTILAEDFLATVFQHELDHLDGVLYVDRVENKIGGTNLAFIEEYQRFLVPKEEDVIRELPD